MSTSVTSSPDRYPLFFSGGDELQAESLCKTRMGKYPIVTHMAWNFIIRRWHLTWHKLEYKFNSTLSSHIVLQKCWVADYICIQTFTRIIPDLYNFFTSKVDSARMTRIINKIRLFLPLYACTSCGALIEIVENITFVNSIGRKG